MEKELRAKDSHITELHKEVSGLREKLKKSLAGGLDLIPYFKVNGFFEIFYEVSLQTWIQQERLKASNSKDDWIPVAKLKAQFEKTIHMPIEISVKRFSLVFSRAIGKDIKAVKGGPKRDLMGFMIKSSL